MQFFEQISKSSKVREVRCGEYLTASSLWSLPTAIVVLSVNQHDSPKVRWQGEVTLCRHPHLEEQAAASGLAREEEDACRAGGGI